MSQDKAYKSYYFYEGHKSITRKKGQVKRGQEKLATVFTYFTY